MNRWYINRGGNVEGPIDEATVIGRIRSGELDGSTQVCPDGGQAWGPLSGQPALASALPGAAGPGSQPGLGAPGASFGAGAPGSYPGSGAPGAQPWAGASQPAAASEKKGPDPKLLIGAGCGVLALFGFCVVGAGAVWFLTRDDGGDTEVAGEEEDAPPRATQISVGTVHSCARYSDGTAWCWGSNSMGQLGDGTTTHHPTDAVRVTGLEGVEEVIAMNRSSCARLADGTVHCWGDNGSHQLGNGTTVDSHTPVPVTGVTGATSLFGDGLVGAVVAGGAVMVWGSNMWQTYVPSLPEDITMATPVPGATGVATVSLGTVAGLCARNAQGSTICTGNRPQGRLAFMGWPIGFAAPTSGPIRFEISHGCYVNEGQAACIGLSSAFSSLGLPSPSGDHTPVPLPGTGYVDVIPIGYSEHSAAIVLKDDGTVSCQGRSCTIGSDDQSYPLPSATGIEEIDGDRRYLCLRSPDEIRCLGQRSGDGEGAPPVWVGDLTTITFPAMPAAQ